MEARPPALAASAVAATVAVEIVLAGGGYGGGGGDRLAVVATVAAVVVLAVVATMAVGSFRRRWSWRLLSSADPSTAEMSLQTGHQSSADRIRLQNPGLKLFFERQNSWFSKIVCERCSAYEGVGRAPRNFSRARIQRRE
jgi:hypothetical protein